MRTMHVVYRDGSRVGYPVDASFKLRVRAGVIPVTFRDGTRGIVPVDAIALARVEETLEEEDE